SDPAADQHILRKRCYSLCRNRLSKQNNRRALDVQRFRSTHRRDGKDFGGLLLTAPVPTVLNQLAYAQLEQLVRTVLPEEELMVLLAIAAGSSYAEIARDHDMTVSGLKSKAFRIREKLRSSRISAALRSRN